MMSNRCSATRGQRVVHRREDGPGRAVELFAGVGGFRLGLERSPSGFDPGTGWRYEHLERPSWDVVWGNQWEPSTKSQPAFDCYASRFPEGVHVCEDIAVVLNEQGVPKYDGRTVRDWSSVDTSAGAIPRDFDLLVGGFPCQDYSVAKPLSQAAGLGGQKGVLWWEIARILQQYRPPHVLLENVDRLLKSPSEQRGRDFAVMLACFAQLGYAVEWRVVNAADYGYPQRRRRVFIYATRNPAELSGLGLDDGQVELDPPRWKRAIESLGKRRLTTDGVLARALECRLLGGSRSDVVSLGQTAAEVDPYDISAHWKPHPRTPWADAGLMVGGVAWTADVESTYAGPSHTLGDMLLPLDVVRDEFPEFLVPENELGQPSTMDHDEDVRLGIAGTWRYLKGAKKVPRGRYHYSEGAVAFPEPLDRAARTVLTGEGGRSPSRFKFVVEQDGVFRRLTPVELERLDMFPDGWTEGMSAGRRAFCVGNALVVGVVDRIGTAIDAVRQGRELRSSRSA
jgi:DNA (cytosine-5)-methyltransferase 1